MLYVENRRNSTREKQLASIKVQFDFCVDLFEMSVCRVPMQFVNFYHYNLSFVISDGLTKCLPYVLS
jgi:hypothetical protein